MEETQPWENPVLVVSSVIFIIAWMFTLIWALLRLSQNRPPALLVLSLSMLTLLALIGGIFTSQPEAWSIAAAGIGALAGSVSAMYGHFVRDEAGAEEVSQSADDDQ